MRWLWRFPTNASDNAMLSLGRLSKELGKELKARAVHVPRQGRAANVFGALRRNQMKEEMAEGLTKAICFIKETQVPFNDGVAKAMEQLRQQLEALRGDDGSLSSNASVALKRPYSHVDERCDARRSVRHRQTQRGGAHEK